MEKACFLTIVFLWLALLPAMAQSHLSGAFVMEGEWPLNPGDGVIQSQGMVGCVEGDDLYCCHRRGFQDQENGFHATVCAINLFTGEVTNYLVPLPERKKNLSVARRYWIRSICVQGERLFLAVQNSVLLYQKGKGAYFEFVKRIPSNLPDCIFFKNGRLEVVERVPEEGRFILTQQGEHGVEMDSVRGFQLPGPFMIQYEPNGFIKQSGNSLYFLASPEPHIEKCSTDGELIADIRLQLPSWRAIPDDLVRKISAMPYGSDRAMYTFFHTKKYSFPLEVHPLSDSMLMLSYHQYDTIGKKEQVLTALVHYGMDGDVKKVVPYSHFFAEDSVIGDGMFPMYYAQRELCLQVADGERLVQLVREAPVEWRRKSGRQYADSVDSYFADGQPELRMRVANLRTLSAERKCSISDLGLRTYEGDAFDGRDFASSKLIFIVNNPPQCHGCEESLHLFVSSLDTAACKICVVFNNAEGYMAKRDQIESVREHLTVPFIPLFVPYGNREGFQKALDVNVFPLVLLRDSEAQAVDVIPNDEVFVDNPMSSHIQQSFIRKITRFLNGKGGTGK